MKDLPIYNIRFYMYAAVVLAGAHTYLEMAPTAITRHGVEI